MKFLKNFSKNSTYKQKFVEKFSGAALEFVFYENEFALLENFLNEFLFVCRILLEKFLKIS